MAAYIFLSILLFRFYESKVKLHRHTSVLLCRKRLALCGKLSKCTTDAEACVARLDNVVDISVRGCLVRVGKLLCVFLFLLCKECLNVLACFLLCLGFLAAKDGNGSAGSHNGNL